MYLADYDLGSAETEIDILVGANYYWSFTSRVITRIDNQLVSLDTVLGRVLSGTFQPLDHTESSQQLMYHPLMYYKQVAIPPLKIPTNSRNFGKWKLFVVYRIMNAILILQHL